MNLHGIDTASRLREICKAITEHADQFLMGDFFDHLLDGAGAVGGCGTAACIAGWGCHLFLTRESTLAKTKSKWSLQFYVLDVRRAIGLTAVESDGLFHLGYWPEQFRCRYNYAKAPTARAAIAVARVEHFIATEGKE